MKKFLKRFLLFLLFAFIVIQFFRPAKNRMTGISDTDITKKYMVPKDVQDILKTSCYDCHSNNTEYPWYYHIQPVAWWMTSHINNAKRGLNFSEFLSYPIQKQYKRMAGISDQVKKDGMPLHSYLWIHKNAKLNDQQKKSIVTWTTAIRDSIKSNYPTGSLIIKQ